MVSAARRVRMSGGPPGEQLRCRRSSVADAPRARVAGRSHSPVAAQPIRAVTRMDAGSTAHPQSSDTATSVLPGPVFGSPDGLHHRSGQQAGRGGRGSSDRGTEQTVPAAHGSLPGRRCSRSLLQWLERLNGPGPTDPGPGGHATGSGRRPAVPANSGERSTRDEAPATVRAAAQQAPRPVSAGEGAVRGVPPAGPRAVAWWPSAARRRPNGVHLMAPTPGTRSGRGRPADRTRTGTR